MARIRGETNRDDSLQDMVERFLLGERHLLEKASAGEPRMPDRPPTEERFDLVDSLLAEHRRAPMEESDFETRLRQLAADDAQCDAAAGEMLGRWEQFYLQGQPVPRRDPFTPQENTEEPNRPGRDYQAAADFSVRTDRPDTGNLPRR